MKLILLSGGSGKRLWPLSNDARSKQFLKVLKSDKDQNESMVQRVWRQLGDANLQENTLIATSKTQVEMLQSQLGSTVPLIVEPMRRDTFPAIALASVYLYSVAKVSLEEVVCILPVDPYVEHTFFESLHQLDNVLKHSSADMALIGVQPTYPSAKYGYILTESAEGSGSDSGYRRVTRFLEKPTEEKAAELINSNALWNCGVFAFRLKYMVELLRNNGYSLVYEDFVGNYSDLRRISFDYEVVEKAAEVVVLPYSGSWKDLGTWNTLTEEIKDRCMGIGKISDDCHHTHLINELEIPITILGVSNVVVAASPDGILVTDKAASPRLKDLVANFTDPPRYIERHWGWSRVLDQSKLSNGLEMLTKRICLYKDHNLSYQKHRKREEVWTVISGEGEIVQNGYLQQVKVGSVVTIPPESLHAIRAVTELEIIEVQIGKELIEEDVERIELSWESILQQAKGDGA
ncbi:sugar phosphate nucleotidyltransferase [Paenibacillus whitsoniae]|uniref:Mannose-1-phosphate guanylyltransferase n=1 Tax=Paenibacillus whitsoniae TaxID=2496558 RepID=A0A3S0I977_9BACL|nr:sugar phosphate nucleotidyltransferase [Paenibacillus whitsoniae]RTE07928.1 mannose-1-phosphate guanylyltransferase [Paenibacillus whitsoniae]